MKQDIYAMIDFFYGIVVRYEKKLLPETMCIF